MGKGKRGNAKPKIIQWVMQRAMETLFGFSDNLAIVSTQREPDQDKEWHFGRSQNNPGGECIKHCLPNTNDVQKTT